MSRSFRYWSRCALVVALTLLVTFNPAWAGRGLRGWLKKRVACQPCCEVVVCCPPVTPACCAPVDCGCSVPLVSSCDCSGVSSTILEQRGVDHGTVVAPAQVPPATNPAHDAPASADQTPPAPVPLPVEPEVSPSDVAPAAIVPQVEAPEPVTEPQAPAQEPVVEEPQSVAPAPIVEEPEPQAAEPEPTVEQPEPFSDEPEQPVVDTEPPAAEPEAPALEPEAPALEPDTPALEPEAPATDSEPPATDLDLFGSEPATNDLFGDTAPSTPDSESANASSDDLFDEPSPATAPSTVENSEELNAEDDLFGAPSQPAEEAADDLFGDASPDANQDGTDENDQDNAEDLFSTPETPVQEANEVEESPAIPSVEAEDDLFGIPSESTPDEQGNDQDSVDLFGLDEDRTWRDNTGTFQVDARLVEIHAAYVRLQKTNGKFCQVPLRRLSVEDRALVELIASSLPPGGSKFVSTPSEGN